MNRRAYLGLLVGYERSVRGFVTVDAPHFDKWELI